MAHPGAMMAHLGVMVAHPGVVYAHPDHPGMDVYPEVLMVQLGAVKPFLGPGEVQSRVLTAPFGWLGLSSENGNSLFNQVNFFLKSLPYLVSLFQKKN